MCYCYLLQVAALPWADFEAKAEATWLSYSGGDKLYETARSYEQDVIRWKEFHELFGGTCNLMEFSAMMKVKFTVDSLIFSVKTLRGLAKAEGAEAKLQRFARTQHKKANGSEFEQTKPFVPDALLARVKVIGKVAS